MKRQLLSLCLGLACQAMALSPAQAQSNCATHEAVVARLAEKFGEVRQSLGIAQNNSLIELFASKETGTWTITMTLPNGSTCLVAAGDAFEHVTDKLAEPGSPA